MSGGELSTERGEMHCWELYYAKNMELFDVERERERLYANLSWLAMWISEFLNYKDIFNSLKLSVLFPSVAIETNSSKWLYRRKPRWTLCIPGNETREGVCSLSYIQAIVLWKCGHWPCDESPLLHEPEYKMACLKNSAIQALQPEATTLQTLHTEYILIKGDEIRTSHSNASI